jgi:hypothetical protein
MRCDLVDGDVAWKCCFTPHLAGKVFSIFSYFKQADPCFNGL